MTKAQILAVVRDECMETIAAADILDKADQRVLVRMTIAVLWSAIEHRVGQ